MRPRTVTGVECSGEYGRAQADRSGTPAAIRLVPDRRAHQSVLHTQGGQSVSSLVTALFPSRATAERAIEDLGDAGFTHDDISMLMSDTTRGREFAMKEANKAPEGAATGATLGGIIGAVVAGLAAVGTLAIPGLALVAAGPVVAGLAGLGAGAAAGGLTGALVGVGIPEHEAKFYDEKIRTGGILLGVYAHDDRKKEAKHILEAAGAERVR
jgi:uncharacterized membrane protein